MANSQPVTPAIAAQLPVARLTLPSLHTVASQPVPGARSQPLVRPRAAPCPTRYTLPNSRAGGIALTMARRPEGHCRCCHDARSLSPCPAQALAHHARRRRPCRGRSPPAAPPRGEFRAPAPAAACRGATSARSTHCQGQGLRPALSPRGARRLARGTWLVPACSHGRDGDRSAWHVSRNFQIGTAGSAAMVRVLI
eukprot:COSAG01_NODE_307_length_19161_cov_67.724321_2_plen_196_part_00